MLYQVAVMKRPRKKKDEEELVWLSDWFVADGPEQAGMKAVMDNSDAIKPQVEFEDMQVLVRPFS